MTRNLVLGARARVAQYCRLPDARRADRLRLGRCLPLDPVRVCPQSQPPLLRPALPMGTLSPQQRGYKVKPFVVGHREYVEVRDGATSQVRRRNMEVLSLVTIASAR